MQIETLKLDHYDRGHHCAYYKDRDGLLYAWALNDTQTDFELFRCSPDGELSHAVTFKPEVRAVVDQAPTEWPQLANHLRTKGFLKTPLDCEIEEARGYALESAKEMNADDLGTAGMAAGGTPEYQLGWYEALVYLQKTQQEG